MSSRTITLNPDWLRNALEAELPGNTAHVRMSGRAPQTMQIPDGAAEAAVMIAFMAPASVEELYQRRPDPSVILPESPDQIIPRQNNAINSRADHSGQISSHPVEADQDLRQLTNADRRPMSTDTLHNPVYDAGLFPLILRPGNQGPHSGQIALPGGKREPDESLTETAIRETEEEIGLDGREIQVLGKLTPLYIPVSGFAVHPFVGWFSGKPDFKRDPLEVDEILFYDLQRLSSPEFRTVYDFRYNGQEFQSPGFRLSERIIWGATAMILMELTEHLQSIASR
tara:strand:+ start:63354 stop:64205 length:852 start_codon:yes stop_codon:yes gene_type:complete